MSLRLRDYEYQLPGELIATRPPAARDESRMMVLHREEQRIEHNRFSNLPNFIAPGDLLVLNNTKVVAARHFSEDGAIELLFLERIDGSRWRSLVCPGRKMRVGATTRVRGTDVRVEATEPDGVRIIAAASDTDFFEGGMMPTPPYLGRQSDAEDILRYQTVFAETPGALAAPTAGLHFTKAMLSKLPHAFVTLHVGTGTFRPVQTENIADHQMHAERFSISASSAEVINNSQKVIAVGTTSVRVLESARRANGKLAEQSGETSIFIHPPYEFSAVDALLTNFHLPHSTLLMLVSAFAGREFVLSAYQEAIREKYRFYSYGDCMLIL